MIGLDLEHISRIKDEEKLLEKIATFKEISYIQGFKNKKEKVATLWAIKEATFKALDIKAGEISYKEIELSHHENGKPFITCHGKAKEFLGERKIEVSLSHTKDIVGAVVIIL